MCQKLLLDYIHEIRKIKLDKTKRIGAKSYLPVLFEWKLGVWSCLQCQVSPKGTSQSGWEGSVNPAETVKLQWVSRNVASPQCDGIVYFCKTELSCLGQHSVPSWIPDNSPKPSSHYRFWWLLTWERISPITSILRIVCLSGPHVFIVIEVLS